MNENQIGEEGNEKNKVELERENETRETRGAKWKFVLAFFLIVAASLGGLVGWKTYTRSQGEKEIRALAEALQKIEQDNLARAMADTYGGKTPQETLRMYIDAVEKGDYELASKYLVEEKRTNEVEKLTALKNKNNLVQFLGIVQNAQPWRSSLSDTTFTMEAKINQKPSYFIEFTKYPNDFWKIIEI